MPYEHEAKGRNKFNMDIKSKRYNKKYAEAKLIYENEEEICKRVW